MFKELRSVFLEQVKGMRGNKLIINTMECIKKLRKQKESMIMSV